MTGSPAWLGAIGFAMSAPVLVVGPIAGALCDRLGHRRIAIAALVSGLLVVLATAILTWAGLMTPTLLLGLVALQAISHAFDSPSRQSLIPLLIDRVHLSEAMALNWATFTVAFFTGPMEL